MAGRSWDVEGLLFIQERRNKVPYFAYVVVPGCCAVLVFVLSFRYLNHKEASLPVILKESCAAALGTFTILVLTFIFRGNAS